MQDQSIERVRVMADYPKIPSHEFVMRAAVEVRQLMLDFNLFEEYAGDKGYNPAKKLFDQMLMNLCWSDKEWFYSVRGYVMNDATIADGLRMGYHDLCEEAYAEHEDFEWHRKHDHAASRTGSFGYIVPPN